MRPRCASGGLHSARCTSLQSNRKWAGAPISPEARAVPPVVPPSGPVSNGNVITWGAAHEKPLNERTRADVEAARAEAALPRSPLTWHETRSHGPETPARRVSDVTAAGFGSGAVPEVHAACDTSLAEQGQSATIAQLAASTDARCGRRSCDEPRFSHVGRRPGARTAAEKQVFNPLTWEEWKGRDAPPTAGEPRTLGREPMDRRGVRVAAWAALDLPGGGGKEIVRCAPAGAERGEGRGV